MTLTKSRAPTKKPRAEGNGGGDFSERPRRTTTAQLLFYHRRGQTSSQASAVLCPACHAPLCLPIAVRREPYYFPDGSLGDRQILLHFSCSMAASGGAA